MRADYYEPYAIAEERHWWFAGRRRILQSVLSSLSLADDSRILEVGCASGGNLAMLSRFGTVKACEYDEGIRQLAASRHPTIPIAPCELPHNLPFPGEVFDLIGLFDVLEHLEDAENSLRSLSNRVATGGYLMVTVPAFQWLWSKHDEINQHFRRYSRRELAAVMQRCDLEIVHTSYFNLILMLPIIGARLVSDWMGRNPADQLKPPPDRVNLFLESIFSAEHKLVASCGLPIGVSLLAVGRRS